MKGNITISRLMGHGINDIAIDIEDKSSGVSFLSVRVSYENFTRAITGLSYIPCEFETRGLDLIGKRRERKTELVFISDGPKHTRDIQAHNAVKAHETGGWKGRHEDTWNFRSRKKDEADGAWYEVTFIRYVENESG